MSKLLAAAAIGAVLGLQGCGEAPQLTGPRAPISGIRFLADGMGDGFRRALEPRAFSFPADHGSHPEFRAEWWYFTGNVFTAADRHFGFELTFFRVALGPGTAERSSAWATNQIWMADFALTDTDARRFFSDERLSRGALQLAGATAAPFRVWVEDWSVGALPDGALRLRARSGGNELDLELSNLDRIVRQGTDGLDRKGPEPGNASYYYSAPRLGVTGQVRSGGSAPQSVRGLAWMDREWGTSALSDGVVGWDWFALQLDDGRDLMYYRLRTDDGSSSAFSGGSLTDPAGRTRRLTAADVELLPIGEWRSPVTRTLYPIQWRLEVPAEDLRLTITPRLPNQEINLSVRYWEGAVTVDGRTGSGSVAGNGYLELAGY